MFPIGSALWIGFCISRSLPGGLFCVLKYFRAGDAEQAPFPLLAPLVAHRQTISCSGHRAVWFNAAGNLQWKSTTGCHMNMDVWGAVLCLLLWHARRSCCFFSPFTGSTGNVRNQSPLDGRSLPTVGAATARASFAPSYEKRWAVAVRFPTAHWGGITITFPTSFLKSGSDAAQQLDTFPSTCSSAQHTQLQSPCMLKPCLGLVGVAVKHLFGNISLTKMGHDGKKGKIVLPCWILPWYPSSKQTLILLEDI